MKHAKGFTLIELVMVVVIVGILAVVVMPSYADVSQQASEKVARQILEEYRTASSLAQMETTLKNTPLIITADDLNSHMTTIPAQCGNYGLDTEFDCDIAGFNYVYNIVSQTSVTMAMITVQGRTW